MMKRLYLLRRGDWLAILLGISLVAGLGALAGAGYWKPFGNYGFGSDWYCSWFGKGEPVCFKNPAKATSQ